MGGVGEGNIGSTQGSKLGKIFSRIPRLEMMFEWSLVTILQLSRNF